MIPIHSYQTGTNADNRVTVSYFVRSGLLLLHEGVEIHYASSYRGATSSDYRCAVAGPCPSPRAIPADSHSLCYSIRRKIEARLASPRQSHHLLVMLLISHARSDLFLNS